LSQSIAAAAPLSAAYSAIALNRCALACVEPPWTESTVRPAIVPSATRTISITTMAVPRSLDLGALRTDPAYCSAGRVARGFAGLVEPGRVHGGRTRTWVLE
jgi:hypothetical protein